MPNYTTQSLVKTYLGIPSGTTSEAPAIDNAIAAAEAEIDQITGRTFVVPGGATAKTYVAYDDYTVYVDDIAKTDGLIVKEDTNLDGTYDTTLTITTDYLATPFNEPPFTGLLNVSDEWPRYDSGRPAVQVTAAYGDQNSNGVPYAVQQAALILAARLYQRKASPLGIMTGFQDYGIARISRQDPDVAALLAQYRVLATA